MNVAAPEVPPVAKHAVHAVRREAPPVAVGAPDFCRTCALSSACAMVGYGLPELSPLHSLMEHLGPYRAGDAVFRQGDAFEAVYAVRAGAVKTRRLDRDGNEQVLGFYLPGEVIGLDAIYPAQFPCDAIALEDAQLCRFSFPAMSLLATEEPAVQKHLFRLIGQRLGMRRPPSGDHGADERMAAFLVDLGDRYAARGFSATQFRLGMSRGDMASYLCLAAETVSRTLGRFRSQDWIALRGRTLVLRQPATLRELGRSLLAG